LSIKEKLIFKLLSGNLDNNFDFNDLVTILNWIGFEEKRKGGSHRIFYKNGIPDIINIQPIGSKAKAYQVKQIRQLFIKYKFSKYGK
jgi:predicted RNA binding protein YcfA (HicA-like mRNA interferase family)